MSPFSSLRRTARSLGLVTVGVLSTLGALSLSHVGPAQGQTPGVNLAQLVAQVNTLQSTVASQAATISSQATTISTLKTQEQNDIKSVQTREQNDITAVQNQEKNDFSSLQKSLSGVQSTLSSQGISISGLQALTAPLSLSGADLTFTGVNVHIVNGQGSTETQNGLGNLIVGYNELRGDGSDNRLGSHNIVTGIYNNFLSSGGIIGGYENSLTDSEEFAVGALNTVGGYQSSVTGGISNTTHSDYASVSGGEQGIASGRGASVTGGIANHADGQDASVTGGFYNHAEGINATITGGLEGTATGDNSAISGGASIRAEGSYSPVTNSSGQITGAHYNGGGNGYTWVGAGLASH